MTLHSATDLISFNQVSFAYDAGDPVITGLDLGVAKGSIQVILGPSGCGKSTVLRLATGLLAPTKGTIDQRANQSSFVFQEAALMPWATVSDNVGLPLKLRGQIDKSLIQDALNQVGLTGFESRYPAQLSGGQRMRVSIARALAAGGDFFCFDEPFAALDELLRFELNDLVLALAAKYGWTVLFVTHSLYEACYLADRIIIMQQGRVAADIIPDRAGIAPKDWRLSERYGETVAACERALRQGGAV